MEKKRRESAAGWVFEESNEGQSNQEAEVTWRLLGRSLGMLLLQAADLQQRLGHWRAQRSSCL
jgi:hypothetical protein